jgi:hypothetical protein
MAFTDSESMSKESKGTEREHGPSGVHSVDNGRQRPHNGGEGLLH